MRNMVGYEAEKEALREILSGDEFTAYMKEDSGEGENLLIRLLNELFEALGRLFPEIEMTEGSSEVLGYFIIAGGMLALLGLSWFLLRLIWVERRAKRRKAVVRGRELEQPPVDVAARAREAAARGDYREATRLLFLALLLSFEQQELLRVAAWKTNWEYAAELEGRGGRWVPLFRESALRFDTVWYGERPITAEEYEAWRLQVEAAIAAAQHAAGTGGGAA